MRRFTLAAGSAALFLTARADPAHAVVGGTTSAAAHEEGRTETGIPVEAGDCFWEMMQERLTIPLGPAYPNFRQLTGREYWVAGATNHHGLATGRW
jgi:hypothetical protein